MEINSPTEFARFISTHGLVQLDQTFIQLVSCINNYGASCNCSKSNEKDKLYGVCVKMYHNGVRNIVPKLKHEFLSKTDERQITFRSEQGQVILIISR